MLDYVQPLLIEQNDERRDPPSVAVKTVTATSRAAWDYAKWKTRVETLKEKPNAENEIPQAAEQSQI